MEKQEFVDGLRAVQTWDDLRGLLARKWYDGGNCTGEVVGSPEHFSIVTLGEGVSAKGTICGGEKFSWKIRHDTVTEYPSTFDVEGPFPFLPPPQSGRCCGRRVWPR